MTQYLLDTNIVSELRRPAPHGAVLAWIDTVRSTDLRVAAVTIAEIQRGIERTRESDPQKATEFDLWLDRVVLSYEIISMDAEIFRKWARLMHGRSDALYEDAMIAATAIVHDCSVATRNTSDFVGFDVPLLNPFLHGRGEASR